MPDDVHRFLAGLRLWLKLVDELLNTFDLIAWPQGIELAFSRGETDRSANAVKRVEAFLPRHYSNATRFAKRPPGVEPSIERRALVIDACYAEQLEKLSRVAKRRSDESIGHRHFLLLLKEWRAETSGMLRNEYRLVQFRHEVEAVERMALARDETPSREGRRELLVRNTQIVSEVDAEIASGRWAKREMSYSAVGRKRGLSGKMISRIYLLSKKSRDVPRDVPKRP